MFKHRKISSIQLEYVVKQASAGIYGQLALIILVMMIQYTGSVPYEYVGVWFALIVTTLISRYIISRRYLAGLAMHAQNERDQFYFQRYMINASIMGFLWTAAFALMVLYSSAEFHFISLAIGLGLVSAAILTMGPITAIFLSFSLPIIVSLLVLIYLQTMAVHTLAFLAAFLAFSYLLYTAYRFSHYFTAMHENQEALKKTQLAVVQRLGKAGEFRDEETGNHIHRMSHASRIVARKLGFSSEKAYLMLHASAMHDVGKIGIPDHILLKPGKLDAEEWEIMKSHTNIGASILGDDDSQVLKMAKVIAQSHHEKWDGTGYPEGLKGEEIPLEARITSICDVYDALTSVRPYKVAWSSEEAVKLIKEESGSHFDPAVVDAFLQVLPKVIEVSEHYA